MDATATILDCFRQVSAVPRQSRDEGRIRAWLQGWAADHHFVSEVDEAGNLLIRVPASEGHESAEGVVLQGHMDMVCEKTPSSNHNFKTDPIVPVVEGEWLTAPGTTLGADNGIAIAMAMVAATTPGLVHPALDLLFTVDEETGLTGAIELRPGWLRGTRLINIDSEDEGVITVGCAGGVDTHLYLPATTTPVPTGLCAARLQVGGLSGGHSGVDIQLQRGNAIRVLARALAAISAPLRLADITGGSAHNAIPRDARALILLPEDSYDSAAAEVSQVHAVLATEFQNTDPGLFVRLERVPEAPTQALSPSLSQRALDFIMVVPHGVAAMSTDIDGLVETSNNEATVALKDGELVVQSSQRSTVMSRLAAHTARIEALARLVGGRAASGNGYPSWQPDMSSPLLARSKRIYAELFGHEPVVEIIHAGLECGLVGAKYPGMDMISIGPTIQFPHCPDERLHIPTIALVWRYLVALLADLAD